MEQEANGFAPAAQKIDDIDVDVAEIEAATAALEQAAGELQTSTQALEQADQTINIKITEFDNTLIDHNDRLTALEQP